MAAVSEEEVVAHALLQMDVEARQHGGTPLWVLDEGMCVHHVCLSVQCCALHVSIYVSKYVSMRHAGSPNTAHHLPPLPHLH
jgi:hypothetical protein